MRFHAVPASVVKLSSGEPRQPCTSVINPAMRRTAVRSQTLVARGFASKAASPLITTDLCSSGVLTLAFNQVRLRIVARRHLPLTACASHLAGEEAECVDDATSPRDIRRAE